MGQTQNEKGSNGEGIEDTHREKGNSRLQCSRSQVDCDNAIDLLNRQVVHLFGSSSARPVNYKEPLGVSNVLW